MKKLLSLLLTICMVVSILAVGAVSASAQTYDTIINIDGKSYIASVGDTFNYTVYFNYSKKLSAGQIEIPYHSAYLSYPTEATLNSKMSSYMPIAADTAAAFLTDDGLIFNFATANAYSFSSNYALRLSFKVLKKGTIDMTPVLREIVGENGSDVIDIDGNNVDTGFKRTVEVDLAQKNTYTVSAPRISSISNTTAGIKLSWTKPSGAVNYRIYRKSGSGSFAKLADTTSLSYEDKTVVSGTAYVYTIRCISKDAKSFTSEYVRDGWRKTFVSAPVISGFECVSDGLKVKWGAVTGAGSYRLYRKTGSSGWSKVGDTTATSLTDKKVTGGTAYTYTVRAYAKNGDEGSYTSGKSYTFVTQPVISSLENVNGGVKVTWAKPAGAVKYRIFRKTASTGWAKVGETTSLTYTDKTASSGATYWYTVRCITKDAKSFASYYDTTGKSITYYATPSLPTVTLNAASVKLTWTAVVGAYNYRVYRKVGSGGWSKLADTTSLSYTDSAVTSGTKYTYTIRCLSEDGKTTISSYNATGKAVTFIAAPAAPTLKNSKSGVVISWKKPAGAVKYRIFRKTGTGGWTKLADTTALTYTDTKAKNGTKYSYTIRCVSSDGKSFTSAYNTTGTAITCKK